MIIIGEKINSSIPSMFEAIKNTDSEHIKKITQLQIDCGADYIDINAGLFEDEIEKLSYLLEAVLPLSPKGIAIDSTNPKTIEAVLKQVSGPKVIINSISLQKARLAGILPLIKAYNVGVVALPLDDICTPKNADERVLLAEKLIDVFTKEGLALDYIYLDIIAETLSSSASSGREALLATATLRKKYPEIHLSCGLSNVSYGLPKRKYLNTAFLTAAITMGLDTAIMDITSPDMRMALKAALLVNGQDDYCTEYISEFRETF